MSFDGGDRRYFFITRAYKPTEKSYVQRALRIFLLNTTEEILKDRDRK
jgi:hypothetical protein